MLIEFVHIVFDLSHELDNKLIVTYTNGKTKF